MNKPPLELAHYFCNSHYSSCASEVHIIAMYEPEGTNRRGNEDPSVIPDVEVSA